MNFPKIVALGDSLTEGYGIDLSVRWTNLVEREFPVKIINSGISGDTTAGMLGRFQSMVVDHHPSHVIIMGGTNDIAHNLTDEQIFSNLVALTRQARHHKIQTIIGIPTPFIYPDLPDGKSHLLPSQIFSTRINVYQKKLKTFALEDGHPFIDFSILKSPSLFLPDGVHPNEHGQEVMKEEVILVLQNVLGV